ncbi:MAG: hypothetical protein CVV02_03690 [Firmicutes bacterium HGW-Firmicutes-7]|nr:MAG: hypothetical protein CVV02_03690 [Firmicutes bacterium HGW-Firmicutes-7]
MQKRLIICALFILLLAGCQDRKVTKLVEVDQNSIDYKSQESDVSESILENTTQNINESSRDVDGTTSSENAKASSEVTNGTPNTSFDDVKPQPDEEEYSNSSNLQKPIIIAKSEDLEDINERTLILNEIDDLLDTTLSSLEKLEEDTLSDDNIVEEGGIE